MPRPTKHKRASLENGVMAPLAKKVMERNELDAELFRLRKEKKQLEEGKQIMEKDNANWEKMYSELAKEHEVIREEFQCFCKTSTETLTSLETELKSTSSSLTKTESIREDLAQSEAALRSEVAHLKKRNKELEKLVDKMRNLVEESPTSPSVRRSFGQLSCKAYKSTRCDVAVDWLRKLIGAEDLDDFITFFVQYLSESPEFAFRLQFTEEETAMAKLKFKWSDEVLKQLKAYCVEHLGFDVFATRASADALLKQVAPRREYDVEVVDSERSTSSGKVVHEKTTVAQIVDLKKMLSEKLTTLARNGRLQFDEGTQDQIVVGVGGDKGGETTKLCLVLENVEKPNNPYNIILLGYYHGSDNHRNLEEKMLKVFAQVNQLYEIEYEDPIFGKVRKSVLKKPLGDCLFLSSVYNHHGPMASDPCFICEIKYATHGKAKAVLATAPFDVAHRLRTIASYIQTGRPLLLIDPADAGPPGIHTIHGVTQKYVIDYLFALANAYDYPDDELPKNLEEQKKYLRSLQEEERMYQNRHDGSKKSSEAFETLKKAYQRMEKRGTIKKGNSAPCASPCCIANDVKKKTFKKTDFHQCPGCKKFFHIFCNLIVTPDDRFAVLEGARSRECQECLLGSSPNATTQISSIDILLAEVEKNLADDELSYCTVRNERESLEGALKKSNGAMRQKLEKVFKSIGCDHRIWFQEMTGNQIRRMLRHENIRLILDVFPDTPEIQMIGQVMEELCYLMSQANNKVKSDPEIDEIELSVARLVAVLRVVHAESGVILKLHLLSAHLVPYLRQHHSWGRVTEQGIEALHRVWNESLRTYHSIRDPELKATLMLQRFLNYNLLYNIGK